jgi:hypothetical protein
MFNEIFLKHLTETIKANELAFNVAINLQNSAAEKRIPLTIH